MKHVVDMRSIELIHLIRYRREIRYWLNACGELVGTWHGRNGKRYAVGHNPRGQTIVFRAA